MKKQAKMLFISNAIEQGYSVKKNADGTYTFTKDKKQVKSVQDKDFLHRFIQSCLNQ